MKVLVTGHTGFIGSNMVKFLEKEDSGIEIIGYSKNKGQDLFDVNKLRRTVKGCNIVYHFAAYAKPAESVLNPSKAIEINIKGTLNVLEACKMYNVPLIYPSSCEIYGDSEDPITEDFPINPPNPYAASKAAADRICYTFFKTYDLDVKIVRLFNPYGRNQQLNKIIPTFYFQAVKNEPITIFGDGSDTRDYVHVEDIVNGLWLSQELPPGDAINLATKKATTNLEVAKIIIEITDSKSELCFVDYPKVFGNIRNQIGSYEKAKNLIGWEPKVDLLHGIKKTVEWLNEIE